MILTIRVVATIRERLSLKKGINQHLAADSYNLDNLVHQENREEYQIDDTNRFSALEGLEIPSIDGTCEKIKDRFKAFAK